jgi:cytochrome c oxidase subunit 4
MALDTTTAHTHSHAEAHVHGGPKLYALILVILLILTGVTVGAASINFGSNMANVIIAMIIASIKASLVALFFMHLKYDKPMNGVIFCASLFFLALFLISCYGDTAARYPTEPTNLKVPPAAVSTGTTPNTTGVAPSTGHGTPGATSPSGGGPAIPGASPEGSHGGAAVGDRNSPVGPPSH